VTDPTKTKQVLATGRRRLIAAAGLASPMFFIRNGWAAGKSMYVGTYTGVQGEYMRRQVIPKFESNLACKIFQTENVTLGNIARTYASMGDVQNAIKFQTLTDQVIEKNLALNLAIGSERQKLSYFDSLSERTDRTISLHVNMAPGDSTARDLAVLAILQRKGRVLDAMSTTLSALRQRLNSDDRELLDELNATTAQLAKLELNGPGQLPPDDFRKQISRLEEQKEKLESEISRRSTEFRAQTGAVTLAAVQAAIPRGAALIEFVTYRPFNPRVDNLEAYGEPRYIAYVLRSQGDVRWKDLGEAKAIDSAVGALRQALREPTRSDVRDLARKVDEKVMQPVRALLGETTQLLISPDSELNLIPFGALVDEDGRYLIQRYSFTYLTSGRDLLRMQVARENRSGPLVIANALFGEPAAEQLARVSLATKSNGANGSGRSVTTARDLSEVYFAPLGGTAEEARSIQTRFPDTTMLLRAQATKAALKQIAAPRILHIATHGFFLSAGPTVSNGSVPRAAATGPSVSVPRAVATGSDNPLLRSGLALAGANLHDNTNDNGILTALEASGLNLWGTKLVVLSACDTGVGEVRNGEGVYGLRRSFVLAGAESLVMTLWPISDYTTRQLMIGYYRNLNKVWDVAQPCARFSSTCSSATLIYIPSTGPTSFNPASGPTSTASADLPNLSHRDTE